MQVIPIIEHRPGRPEHREPWHQLTRVRDCLRPDGRYGTAEITGEPDTFFTVPARMSVGGRKVSGYVSSQDFGEAMPPGSEQLAELIEHPTNNGWDLMVYVFHPVERGGV